MSWNKQPSLMSIMCLTDSCLSPLRSKHSHGKLVSFEFWAVQMNFVAKKRVAIVQIWEWT